MSDETNQDLDEDVDLRQSLRAIRNVLASTSWFGEFAHRSPGAAKPIHYAMSCIEVVLENSEKARAIFNQIVEAWGKPGVHALYEKVMSNVPDEEKEKWRQTVKSADVLFEQDPNKPFKNIEETWTDSDATYAGISKQLISTEEQQWLQDWEMIAQLILKFILVGFNRESDANKGKYKVVPTEKSQWLITALAYRTLCQHKNISFDISRNEMSDLDKLMAEGHTNRAYRRLVARAKKAGMKLTNDRIYMNAARHWYQCRVVNSSIDKYIHAGAEGYSVDRENLRKQIQPCDKAVGYVGT